ncbi:hypothetical protein BO82DRAFT_417498 [Aspergillus uvarum CBS 121591]|uniref:Altered inheritance of mitochondria protein 9, mitochondrial n=1 Tax=Aspergillus uvarum CBS 121591 TaxID=1448315 RepID=A0A319CXW5_9EURO|nr:hypothetical protein BO82DRAFT_417498 [Aspergillus uvarum CBS 121591]PYH80488.1 hypothetical protein BO82DRAFT_417498 [Aspergillus uvarum CBS 121591]
MLFFLTRLLPCCGSCSEPPFLQGRAISSVLVQHHHYGEHSSTAKIFPAITIRIPCIMNIDFMSRSPHRRSRAVLIQTVSLALHSAKDAEQLAARYRKFRLPALIDAAIGVAGSYASSCTKVIKCIEGQYNKSLILSMDNGQEVVAQLHNPNAGPKFYTSASEVATRQFLRDHLAIPVPRIYLWTADETNAVGAEYILEQPLGLLWSKLPFSARSYIVDIERRLSSVTFPGHGCIYFQSGWNQTQNTPILFQYKPQTVEVGPDLPSARLDLQRGPFKNMAEYARAIARNEIQWAQTHAQPRMNVRRSEEQPETADEYLGLLERYACAQLDSQCYGPGTSEPAVTP